MGRVAKGDIAGITIASYITLGNAAHNPNITQTCTGQVTFNGNLDATNGLDVTGAAFSFTGAAGSWQMVHADSALTQPARPRYFTGNVDATNGLDVTGSNLTVGGTNFIVDQATGNVTAGTINKVTITATATSATLTVANGKTFTASNTTIWRVSTARPLP